LRIERAGLVSPDRRGNERRPVFRDDRDGAFLRIAGELGKLRPGLFAYC